MSDQVRTADAERRPDAPAPAMERDLGSLLLAAYFVALIVVVIVLLLATVVL